MSRDTLRWSAGDFAREHVRIAEIPAVGNEQHDRASAQNAPCPLDVERVDGVTDPRAARPVADRVARRAAARRPASQPANCRVTLVEPAWRKTKTSTRALAAGERVREQQEHARVRLHRSADVADENQRARRHRRVRCGMVDSSPPCFRLRAAAGADRRRPGHRHSIAA